MQQATSTAERVVAVLSAAYLRSEQSEAEWQAFQAKDPLGKRGLLLPVRIEGRTGNKPLAAGADTGWGALKLRIPTSCGLRPPGRYAGKSGGPYGVLDACCGNASRLLGTSPSATVRRYLRPPALVVRL
jgi:hypothetical protein